MTHESLLNQDWEYLVKRLGGAAFLERSARETGAFLQARVIKSAVVLLRLLLAYCVGDHGLRLTAAWATSMGLVNISAPRSEEHTSELQSRFDIVCRLLLEKKKYSST